MCAPGSRLVCDSHNFKTVATSVTGGTIFNWAYGKHKNLYTLVFRLFFQQYLVLFTMVPRNTAVR